MASSGSFSGSIHSGHYVLRVDWTQTKNISANTSTVTAKAYLVNDWSLSIYGRSDNSITINGTAQIYESPAVNGTGTHLLGTVTQTVNHNSDGTKSLTMSAVFYIRATLSGTYYESITALQGRPVFLPLMQRWGLLRPLPSAVPLLPLPTR